jgi:hypothetical protein
MKDIDFLCEQPICAAAPVAVKRKRYRQEQHREWEQEAVRLAKTRRYRNKLDICRSIKKRIELEDGTAISAEHICRTIKIPPSDFQQIIKNNRNHSDC